MRIFKNRHMRWPWLTTLGYDREKLMGFRWYGRIAMLLLVMMAYVSSMRGPISHNDVPSDQGEAGVSSRHLLSATPTTTTDCDSIEVLAGAHGMPWETCEFEMAHVKEIWVIIHAFGIFIIFVALAIICDDFFVPSLEAISEKLRLSEDVAGATFMAAGSSAPELFTSIVGVAFETDVGVGTIVGSAVFNILIIIALTAALAGQVLALDWRPMFRDGFYYGVSIALFIAFSWDGVIELYEAIILLVLYLLYIVVMVFNNKLMDLLGSFQRRSSMVEPTANGNIESSESQTSGATVAGKKMSMTGGHARRLSVLSQTHRSSLHDIHGDKHVFHHTHHGGLAGNFHVTSPDSTTTPQARHPSVIEERDDERSSTPNEPKSTDTEHEEEEEDDPVIKLVPCLPAIRTSFPAKPLKGVSTSTQWFCYVVKVFLFIISFPFVCLFSWTIPDCSKDHNKKYFLASFILSVIWIAVLSVGMVTLVSRCGCILGVDNYTMGLVVVAIGTSVPDALSSILVARDGYGDMAVSNAIGSNVFDIDLGLGLPFIINIIIRGPIKLLNPLDQCLMDTGQLVMTQHAKFGFILMLILLMTIVTFCAARFKLNRGIGVTFVCIYILFLVYAFVQEFQCQGVYC